jgi:hypothetical protein
MFNHIGVGKKLKMKEENVVMGWLNVLIASTLIIIGSTKQ